MDRIKVFQIYIPQPNVDAIANGIVPKLIEDAVNQWLEANDGKIQVINSTLVDISRLPYAWVMVTYRVIKIEKEIDKPKTKTEPPIPIVLPKKDEDNPNRFWRENRPDLDGWG